MPDRQLLLLRHAKAVIGPPGMADFDRPLAERGQSAARRMGRYLMEQDLLPDLVLCSPAARTKSTWELASSQWPQPVPLHLVDALYDFGDGTALLNVIREQGGGARRLLLVTHNPATQALALGLSGSGPKALRREMAEKYPTAGLAILSFTTGDWGDTAEGAGRLDAFVRPRDLDP